MNFLNLDYLEYLAFLRDVIPSAKSIYAKYQTLDEAPLYVPKWQVLKSIGDELAALMEKSPFKYSGGSVSFGSDAEAQAYGESIQAELKEAGFNPGFILLAWKIWQLIKGL